jgi:DNA replication protein DnaC
MTNNRQPPRPSTSKPQQTAASPTPANPAPANPAPANPTQKATAAGLRDQILADFATLRVPLSGEQLDELLRMAEQQGISHLEFLQRLVGTQAQQRRERAIERRIRDACFREVKLLEDFNWKFNAAIDRAQIEQLATGEFVRRGDNLVFVGQSGVGKSHLVQALGRQCCVLGYHVRYTTSAKLLQDLTAALADQTLPARLSYWTRFEWLIIDEFGFDRLERTLSPQAANLLYKVIDGRSPQRSTGLVTNIDFEAWADYLGDPPLAMAFLDRVVDGAILLKVQGRSYRAQRAQRPTPPPSETPS